MEECQKALTWVESDTRVVAPAGAQEFTNLETRERAIILVNMERTSSGGLLEEVAL